MCRNATKTAASLMAAIKPTIVSLLTISGIANTPNGIAAMKAYDAALVALQSWQPGNPAENVLQLIADFQQVFNVLPIPGQYMTLVNIILAGLQAVIGVIMANSPAPAAPEGMAPHPEAQAMHAVHVAAETSEKVAELVPGFRRSIWHSPESQYSHTWDKAVIAGGFPEELKVA